MRIILEIVTCKYVIIIESILKKKTFYVIRIKVFAYPDDKNFVVF